MPSLFHRFRNLFLVKPKTFSQKLNPPKPRTRHPAKDTITIIPPGQEPVVYNKDGVRIAGPEPKPTMGLKPIRKK